MKFKIKFLIFLCLLIAGIAGCSAAKKDANAHPDKVGILGVGQKLLWTKGGRE